jgi:GAF domain-containing protein
VIAGDVVPVMRGSEVVAEIDVDSDTPGALGERDRRMLEAVAALLAEKL